MHPEPKPGAMEPTNDPTLLRDAYNCPTRCPECLKSLCLYDHEPWKCRCGHARGYHLEIFFHHFGYWTAPNHPHPCSSRDCDCEALWYDVPSDHITNEEAIRGLCEVVEDLGS